MGSDTHVAGEGGIDRNGTIMRCLPCEFRKVHGAERGVTICLLLYFLDGKSVNVEPCTDGFVISTRAFLFADFCDMCACSQRVSYMSLMRKTRNRKRGT